MYARLVAWFKKVAAHTERKAGEENEHKQLNSSKEMQKHTVRDDSTH